ncbi:MAG: PAS domain S-box protein [Planctomycetes bacterium]|nr:PAS domain S-box protein [Planctomycetota bacterium]
MGDMQAAIARNRIPDAVHQGDDRLLDAAFTEASAALMVVDRRLAVRKVNRKASALLGAAAADAHGLAAALRHCLTAEDAGPLLRQVRRTIATGEPYELTGATAVRRDGVRLLVDLAITRLCAPDGTILGALCAAVDASDRPAVASAQGTGDRSIEAALAAAGMATWSHDARTGVTSRSASYLGLLGVESGDVLANVHPGDAPRVRDALRRSLAVGVHYCSDFRVVLADGSTRWLVDRAEPVHDAGGRPVGLLGVLQDVTDHRLAEQALHESEARNAAIVASALDAIVTMDADGRVTGFNPAAEATFGISRESAIGRAFPELAIPVPNRVRVLRDIARRLADGGVGGWRREMEAMRADGSRFPAEFTISAVRLPSGMLITAHIRDITLRRRAEDALCAKAVELERAVAELGRSNGELEQFAAVASHDLQEPLRMVGSYLSLLASRCGDRLDGKAEEYLAKAVDGSQRMSRLIRDLLEYCRVGRGEVPDEPVALAEVVAEVMRDLQIQIQAGAARIEVGALPTLRADRIQMRQLFQNLLSNALKYRSSAPPVLTITAQVAAAGWQVSVADNGIGIPAEACRRIFEPFTRLHGRGAYPGNGIGLAICRRIVERHGGRIWAEPGAPRGSVFHICLPADSDSLPT